MTCHLLVVWGICLICNHVDMWRGYVSPQNPPPLTKLHLTLLPPLCNPSLHSSSMRERLGNREVDRMIISIRCHESSGGLGEEVGSAGWRRRGLGRVFTSYSSSTLDPLVFLSIAVSHRHCYFPERQTSTDYSRGRRGSP